MPPSNGRRAFFLVSFILVLAIVSGSLSIAAIGEAAGEDSLYKYLSVFTEVINLVRRAYVDETSVDALMNGALEGTTDALDPFSTYVPAESIEVFLAARELGDRRSGLTLGKERGITFVVAVVPGGPAAAAGLEEGDIVTALADRSTRELLLWEMQTVLAGEPGTKLALDVLRLGEERKVELTLASVPPAAPTLELEGDAGVLRIPDFGPETAAVVSALIASKIGDPRQRGRGGLLVDLRSGAAADAAHGYAVAALFVQGPLGELKGRGGTLESFTGGEPAVWTGDLVVLVDRGTVGAAEVLAETLRQGAGAEIVGQRTFGWAGRQELVALSDGSRVLLTAGFFTAGDGEPLREGLEPDLEVDEASRSFRDAEVPLDEIIYRRGLERLRELASGAERKVA